MSCGSLEDPLLLLLNVWASLAFGAKMNTFTHDRN